MSDPDPKTTLREFQEYLAVTYEANHKIAARIGVTAKTFADWLTGDRQPMGKSLEKLRGFLDAEAKRNAGDGIRPIERVPFKIVKPAQQVRYARLCPFCRKARVKIQSNSRKQFQGVCPKCGASGPKRKSQKEALRAWNGERIDEGRKRAASDHTERFSGGIKVNLDVPDPIEICGRT